MRITKDEVKKVALLARLRVADEEQARLAEQLSTILDYVEQLKAISTENVDPTATGLDAVNVFREDVVEPSLTAEQATGNAPDAEGGTFRVPKIIESR